MTTPCVIARKSENIKGRYVSCSGSPFYFGNSLVSIIRRDGTERALSVLVDENFSWYSIDETVEDDNEVQCQELAKPCTKKNVIGYGTSCVNTANPYMQDKWWEIGDVEYSYVVDDDGVIEVYRDDHIIGKINPFHNQAKVKMNSLEIAR